MRKETLREGTLRPGAGRALCRRAPWAAALIVALFATSGCVTRGTYNEARADRERIGRENERLVAENERLRQQMLAKNQQVTSMGERLAEERKEAARAQTAHEMLVAQLQRELAEGELEVELMSAGVKLRLPGDTLFRSGSSQLEPEGMRVLKQVASELRDVPYQIVVAGHTDNVPISKTLARTHPTNWDLAAARAAAVTALFQGEGIPGKQLLAASFADTQPVASNDTEAGRAQNRRIEIRVRPMPDERGETPGVAAGPPQ